MILSVLFGIQFNEAKHHSLWVFKKRLISTLSLVIKRYSMMLYTGNKQLRYNSAAYRMAPCLYTAISRKVVGKMCMRQSRKVICDMIDTLFLTTLAVEPTFVAFLQHSQTHFHGLSCQFFQISLKNSELKTTHNAFRDCRVHFFRQPFSKQLYVLVFHAGESTNSTNFSKIWKILNLC